MEEEKMELFIAMLRDVFACATNELFVILDGKTSEWNAKLIVGVVIPEVSKLLEHALDGEVYFRYSPEQRLLLSTYYKTDSLVNLDSTTLGQKISMLQKLYYSM